MLPALALPPLAGRHRAGGDPRERGTRPLPRLSHQSLQADRLRAVGERGGDRGHALGVQSPLRLGRAARRGLLGRACRHGGDRRHAQLSRTRAWCVVLHPFSRVSIDLDTALAVLFRPAVRRLHRVLADRPCRRRRTNHGAVPQAHDRGRRHGRPSHHRACGTAANLSPRRRKRSAGAADARAGQAIRRYSRSRRH